MIKTISRNMLPLFIAFLIIIPAKANPLPGKQLMVVITSSWNVVHGKLYCYQWHYGKWVLQFSNPVVVGAKGLGAGNGIVKLSMPYTPVKKEGDNKAPAGIFTIGAAFGYANYTDARWIKKRYLKASDTLICVDDAQSVHYNTLLATDTTTADWHSHEDMHLKNNAYKWGLFINHNASKTVAGDGSCIFMHIWRDSSHGTAGCTAMPEACMLRVLHWINEKDNPLLVQLTRNNYKQLRIKYGLPAINFN